MAVGTIRVVIGQNGQRRNTLSCNLDVYLLRLSGVVGQLHDVRLAGANRAPEDRVKSRVRSDLVGHVASIVREELLDPVAGRVDDGVRRLFERDQVGLHMFPDVSFGSQSQFQSKEHDNLPPIGGDLRD